MNKIGNWIITSDLIEWDQESQRGWSQIPQNRLLELTEREGIRMYDWLIHMPSKTWLTVQDVKDLNLAFNKLALLNNLPVDRQILEDTLNYQENILATK